MFMIICGYIQLTSEKNYKLFRRVLETNKLFSYLEISYLVCPNFGEPTELSTPNIIILRVKYFTT